MILGKLFNFEYKNTRYDGKGGLITQFFGERHDYYFNKYGIQGHNGIDLGVPDGTEIIAPIDMTITFAGTDPISGNIYVVGEYEEGNLKYELRFLHLQKHFVVLGQRVLKGMIFALSNNTGVSSGPHLHFGIRRWQKIDTTWLLLIAENGYRGFFDPIPLFNIQQQEDMKFPLKRLKGQTDIWFLGFDGKRNQIINAETFNRGKEIGLWGDWSEVEQVDILSEPEGSAIILIASN